MRIRKIIEESKILTTDTNWKEEDLPPRYSGIFEKTKPMRADWKWRSVQAKSEKGEYIFLTQCNPKKDEWKAWLICKLANGKPSIVSRLEYHGTHPGLHAHVHCDRGGLEEGPSSIDGLARIPAAGCRHRRVNAWRENTFWEKARQYFRINHPTGPLL
jgi:hypothetical protein